MDLKRVRRLRRDTGDSQKTLPEKEMRTWAQVGETDVGREKTLVLCV